MDRPLEFLLDRSLGKSLAEGLRRYGLTVHTLASVYGEQRAQRLPDVTWLDDAGERGWTVLTKDNAIRRRPSEREPLMEHRLRVFCITNAQLTGSEQLARLVANRHRILRQAQTPGPYIYGVYANRIERLWPK